jgi:hypothetical protein
VACATVNALSSSKPATRLKMDRIDLFIRPPVLRNSDVVVGTSQGDQREHGSGADGTGVTGENSKICSCALSNGTSSN